MISRSLEKLLVPGPSFKLTTKTDCQRQEVEAFIANKFLEHHNARVDHFLPALLNIHCCDKYTAALGIGPAGNAPMFAEQYLDQTAEQAIAAVTHSPVCRQHIVEIGNLVSSLNGATALLYLMLLAVVKRAGFHWVIFTATPEVQRSITKMGFKIAPICAADPSRLQGDMSQWGNYYDSKPWVMVGYVDDSFQACQDNQLLDAILKLTEPAINQLAQQLGSL